MNARPRLAGSRVLAAVCGLAVALVALCNWRVARAGAGTARHGGAATAVRDVAIVPGTSAGGLRPPLMLRARLEAARDALQSGRVRAILVSGNEAAGEVTVMRAWLERRGVAASQILVDPDGTRTFETMRNAARRFGISTALVCTQDISMDRTLYLARANGIDAVGLAVDGDAPHNLRWVGREALKSTLAVVETTLR